MKLRWTRAALSDLSQIAAYIRQDNPIAARKVVAAIRDKILPIEDWPHIGREGRIEGTREFVIFSYIVVYRIVGETVFVVRIYHGAQNWP